MKRWKFEKIDLLLHEKIKRETYPLSCELPGKYATQIQNVPSTLDVAVTHSFLNVSIPREKERPQGRQPARHDSTEWSGPTWKVDGFMSSSGWFLCWWSIRVLPCLVFCCISVDKFGEVSGSSWVVFYHIAVVKTWTARPKSLKYTHSGGYVTDAAAAQPEGPGYASGLHMEDPQTTGFLSSNFWVGIYWDILGLYN